MLKEEVDREARKIQREIEDRDDLDDISVSEDMETSLFEKIQEYEYDKRLKKEVRRRKKKHRLFFALAAVLILVCGSVMTGTGSKSYWKVLWDRIAGDESLSVVNVEQMESQETKDLDEVQVFNEIRKRLGIYSVRFGYMPMDMFLRNCEIDEEQDNAVLFYTYNDNIIKYSMYMNDDDSSQGQIEPDELIQAYQIDTGDGIPVIVKEYAVKDSEDSRYIAEFEYMDAQYEIKGVMEREEFEEIIKNLIFYNENA